MTLYIPPVPNPKKGFRFPGAKAHKARQDAASGIKGTIEALITSTHVPAWQEMFRKFAEVLNPGAVRPVHRLPYPATGPHDRRGGTKIGCVYARLSWLTQLYWDMVLDGKDTTEEITEHCHYLLRVAKAGIPRCLLTGNEADGYRLSVPHE